MKSFIKNNFVKNVATLVAGTSVAQLIPILISPILTRIYSPEDFGLYATIVAISSVCAISSCLRYEYAIVQEKNKESAISLVKLSLYICFIFSFLIFISILFFQDSITNFFNLDNLKNIIFFVPIIVLSLGLFKTLNFWNTRTENYENISLSTIYQSVSVGAGQIFLKFSQFGLIFGYLFGHIIGVLSLLLRTLKNDKELFSYKTDYLQLKHVALKYKKFPILSSPAAIADSLSVQLPILLIVKSFSSSVAGFYSLTYRVLNLPATFLSQGIAQPLLRQITKMDEGTYEQVIFILKVFLALLIIITPFTLIIWFYAEDLFSFVFGSEWAKAGMYAKIIIFAVAIKFVVSPLSIIFTLDKNIKIGTVWQYCYLLTLSVTLISFSSKPITTFLIAFTVHEVLLYFVYLIMILGVSLPKYK